MCSLEKTNFTLVVALLVFEYPRWRTAYLFVISLSFTSDNYEIRSHTVRSKLGWRTLQERRDKIMSKLMKQIVDNKSIN